MPNTDKIIKPEISKEYLESIIIRNTLINEKINWRAILMQYRCSEEILEKNIESILQHSSCYSIFCMQPHISEKFYRKMIEYCIKDYNGSNNRYSGVTLSLVFGIKAGLLTFNSIDFVLEHLYEACFDIWKLMTLTEDQMEYILLKTNNFKAAAQNGKLTKNIIRKYKDNWDWTLIYTYQQLDEEFIEELDHKTYWDIITAHQTHLSEKFIEKHSSEINFNWKNIVKYQKNISEEFIDKHRLDILTAKTIKKYR